MTLLERLQAHKGGIIKLKTQLYWYKNGRGWDGNPGRICLLLDVSKPRGGYAVATVAARTTIVNAVDEIVTSARLLIDGSPHCVLVVEQDVELLNEAR